MHRSSTSAFSRRRSAHRAARLRRRRVRAAWWTAIVLVLLAFTGGFLRAKYPEGPPAATEVETAQVETSAPARRAEALRLLDRAVQAKHTELAGEAARLALEARKVDPAVPGVALLIAEMAMRQGDAVTAAKAAQDALAQSQYADDAKLILALNTWMLRGEMGAESAGASALQMLSEAADEGLSNSSVRFFAGDLQRANGRPSEAHRSLLGGLYRQQAWQSAAVLGAKIALALEESGPDIAGAAPWADEQAQVFGAPVAALGRAESQSPEMGPALAAVRATLTQKHLKILARDPALSSSELPEKKAHLSLPFERVSRPVPSF